MRKYKALDFQNSSCVWDVHVGSVARWHPREIWKIWRDPQCMDLSHFVLLCTTTNGLDKSCQWHVGVMRELRFKSSKTTWLGSQKAMAAWLHCRHPDNAHPNLILDSCTSILHLPLGKVMVKSNCNLLTSLWIDDRVNHGYTAMKTIHLVFGVHLLGLDNHSCTIIWFHIRVVTPVHQLWPPIYFKWY